MARTPEQKRKGSPTGSLLVGVSFLALASYWPELVRGIADEAKAIALQLLPEPDDGRNRYFREGARTILRAVMLHLATRRRPELCTLPEMWRVLSSPRRLERLVQEMEGSEALFGMIATLGEDLKSQMEDSPEQFADFRQGAIQVLDIFDPLGWLAESVAWTDVDFPQLKEGKATFYVVIPQDKIATHGAWLGLVTRQAIAAVARSPGKSEVLFVLDEFANMGKLAGLAESLTALPGLGVRVWAFVQELSELVRLYGPHTARTVLSQAEVKQFFAVQDDGLAKTLSAALGQRTVKTKSHNLGRFEDDEIGESLSETGRPLMAADEIRQMGRDEQLLFISRLPPLRAQRIPFWEVQPWAGWAAPNPVEGKTPLAAPKLRLEYKLKGKSNERV
ncbi:type IV secretory system conjugative DNA transfer family protein [Leisingera caerulea]|uniref:type IV secretory system conjugative DNA transfer family protein n=1 Tax=Leisingera caerulea TaxID=506591 RepID=UPI0021A6D9BA|nr:type IV secretory system conjugative DNA transfer family protein [Leisingera caerulea]